MAHVARILRYVNIGFTALAAFCIFVMMVYGFVDVVGRYAFNSPLYGTYELSQLLLATVVFLSLSICQAEDRHMRVDFLITHAGPRMRIALNGFAYLCGIIICAMTAYYSIPPALYSLDNSEFTYGVIRFPVYPVKILVVIGFSALAIQICLDLLVTILRSGHEDARRDEDMVI